jgi:hypothetical protein
MDSMNGCEAAMSGPQRRGASMMGLVITLGVLVAIVAVVYFGMFRGKGEGGPSGTANIGLIAKEQADFIGPKRQFKDYASTHDGRYPDTPSDAGITGAARRFTYVSGGRDSDPADHALMYGGTFDGHRAVLTVSLEDRVLTEKQLQDLLGRQRIWRDAQGRELMEVRGE